VTFEPCSTRTHDAVQATPWLEPITSLQLARSNAPFEQRSVFLPLRGFHSVMGWGRAGFEGDVGFVRGTVIALAEIR
jgi:hypothetical protein